MENSLRKIVDSKYFLIVVGTIGSTISAPGKLNSLYNNNLIFRFLYFFVGIFPVLDYKLPNSIVATLILHALYDMMRSGRNDPYKPFYGTLFRKL